MLLNKCKLFIQCFDFIWKKSKVTINVLISIFLFHFLSFLKYFEIKGYIKCFQPIFRFYLNVFQYYD